MRLLIRYAASLASHKRNWLWLPLVLVGLGVSPARAHAGTCPISPAASSATIVSTVTGCASGSTVTFATGNYSLANTISVPCGVSIAGPTVELARYIGGDGYVRYGYAPTAIISATAYPAFSYGTCSTARSFEYIEVNTNHPSPDGGQAIYASNAGGVSNLTIFGNYFHGNQANAGGGNNFQDGLVLFDGGTGAAADVNDTVSWNRFGASGDCSNVMTNITYGGFGGNGGFCNATAWHTNMSNFTWENNDVYYQEEGLKGYEGTWQCSNCMIAHNDFSNWHRIAIETQVGGPAGGTVVTYNYNSMHDPFTPGSGTFGLSSANGCSNHSPSQNICETIDNYNLIIDNVGTTSGSPFNGLGIEYWSANSGSTGNYNLIQGEWSNSFMIATDGSMTANNNHIQSSFGAGGHNTPADCYPGYGTGLSSNFGWWNVEDGPINTPAGSGNQCDFFDGSVQTSATPVISPGGGPFSGSQTVTLSNSGTNRDANTTIWYTTDGCTPIPGAVDSCGTNQTLIYSAPFAITSTSTVKAIGMWGALNQPLAYPTGPLSGTFGYQPSPVMSATYTASGSLALSSVSISGTGGATTVATGSTLQIIATCHYSDGSTTGCNSNDSHGNSVTSWTSSTLNGTINSAGLLSGVSVGMANVQATVSGGVTSNSLPITVTSSGVTLTSVALSTTGGGTYVVAGTTNQLIATCGYSDGSSDACTTTDAHGNIATAWTSSAPAVGTVNSSGLFSGVAAGGTNVTAGAVPTPASTIGTSIQAASSNTNTGTISYDYGVTGPTSGTWAVGTCNIYLPSGTYPAGGFYDCILTPATSGSTQAANALCSGRYTIPASFTGAQWISIPMTSCPTLPASTAYWLGQATNLTPNGLRSYSLCGSSCNGTLPTNGSGTYGYYYLSGNPFGTYTGMATTLNVGGNSQDSIYLNLTTTAVNSSPLSLTVTAAAPTLSSAYLAASSSSLAAGTTLQMAAHCVYTNPAVTTDCTVADIYGNAVSAWASSNTSAATVGTVGGPAPGLVTGIAAGNTGITAVINGGITSSDYPLTVTAPPVTLTGLSLATSNGVTGLFVGSTNQLIATCTYSDMSTTNCSSTDSHGNVAGSYTSSTTAHATVSSGGLVTGVAPGTTTFTATAGGVSSSPALPLTVLQPPNGVYSIVISGPVSFAGTVKF